MREYVLELVWQHYRDFGPTLAAEMLEQKHGVEVSRETLRKWMAGAGLWLSRNHRKTFHQPRLRRERYGELVQIDGSEHRWFEDRGEPCSLLVFIDDATSKLMQLRFVPSESTASLKAPPHPESAAETTCRLPFGVVFSGLEYRLHEPSTIANRFTRWKPPFRVRRSPNQE